MACRVEAVHEAHDAMLAQGSAFGLLTVTVLQKFGFSRNIKIEYQQP
jgi:hypothetical protein